jgi:uncharacterized membrane protein YfcA
LDLYEQMASTGWVTFLPFIGAGVAVGLFYGCFGAGGSAFATPVLVLLGLPAVVAVATPLPALLPASLAGLVSRRGGHDLDWIAVRRTLAGAMPAAVLGAAASRLVGGHLLLVLSAATLAVVGAGLLWPGTCRRGVGSLGPAGVSAGPGRWGPSGVPAGVSGGRQAGANRCDSPQRTNVMVIVGGGVIGFLTGLLANGGGFLLVPFFAMALGMSMRQAAGTSLVTAAALALPTTVAHGIAGNIDWTVAAAFAAGLVPAALVGSRLGRRVGGTASRVVFGTTLIVFAGWFFARLLR